MLRTGCDHIVEAAFGATLEWTRLLPFVVPSPRTRPTRIARIPFWPLLFKNIRVDFLGSDDFTAADKAEAARAVNEALAAGWVGMPIAGRFPLAEIAKAHETVEASRQRGRVVVVLEP